MEKEFIPYELALRMKELGFDEPCFAFYNNAEVSPYIKQELNDELKEIYTGDFEAPTFSQAFRWFRERDFHVNIESYHCLGNDKPFGLGIDLKVNDVWDYVDYSGDSDFNTYEEAQIKAIETILEIMEKRIS